MKTSCLAALALLLVACGPFAIASAQTCPDSSVISSDGQRCVCPRGSQCVSPDAPDAPDACSTTVDDLFYFTPTGCANCSCVHVPVLHHVVSPTYGTVCEAGQSCDITWLAHAQIENVTVSLLRKQGTFYSPVLTIASNAPNTGQISWTVPTSLRSSDRYSVALVDPMNPFGSVQTPEFTILNNPEGTPCPAGFVSSTGAYPACVACDQGKYASSDQRSCVVCPGGKTTPGRASPNATLCNIPQGSILASFLRHQGRTIDGQDFLTLYRVTVERCAKFCLADKTCKAFDFEYTADMTGTCSLSADTSATALVHTFLDDAGSTFAHYERTDAIATFSISGSMSFQQTRNVYITIPPSTTLSEDASLESCAALCVRSSSCKAFLAGTGSRLGECFLFAKNTSDINTNTQLLLDPAHQLDLYELNFGLAPCDEGFSSPTGREQCTPCARNTYGTDVPRYSCSLCIAGLVTEDTGATSASECVELKCRDGSTPDADGDCTCSTGAQCVGDACSQSASGVVFYPATCDDCYCTTPVQPPTIDFVFTPLADSRQYYGQTINITYQASNGVRLVNIYLYESHDFLDGYITYVGYIALNTPNTGFLEWTIPSIIAAQNEYYIVIVHAAQPGEQRAPTHRNSGKFYIGPRPTGDCQVGSYSASGGYPCSLCPIGTYWASPRECAPCPANTTTFSPGSGSVDDCSIGAEDALYQFTKFPNMYFSGSNAGGEHIEAVDHKTVEECAQLCLDDAGCKAFDAGDPDDFQAGDCFLSYDNMDTITENRIGTVSQLDLYIRQSIEPVLDRFFDKVGGTYLKERDDGGIYEGLFSPETCAQLCLNDVCCKSFDAGQVGESTEYHCFLSYHNRADVAEDDIVFDPSARFDYYEKRFVVHAQFNATIDIVPNSASKLAFESAVISAVSTAIGVDPDSLLIPSIMTSADGFVEVAIVVSDDQVQSDIEDAILQGNIAINFPRLTANIYVATFSSRAGPCQRGSVSQSGNRESSCSTCRANTYANFARTICDSCPAETISSPGSYQPNQCQASSQVQNIFNEGDEWLGHFQAPCAGADGSTVTCQGRVNLQLVSVDGERMRILATFVHGEYCNPAAGCRIESAGVSEFYYDGVLSGSQVVLQYDTGIFGWGGITDRSWVRENIQATLSHAEDMSVVLSGSYGDSGTLHVQQKCSSSYSPTTFNTGDKWIGTYVCERAAVGGVKPPEGVYDVRRIELLVTASDTRSNQVEALVDFDHFAGVGQYQVEAYFDATADCYSVEFTPKTTGGAWLTPHPRNVTARQLAGRLSDNGEHFSGQMNLNTHCMCTGQTSDTATMRGATCDAWDGGEKWCYVSPKCPSAVRDADAQNLFIGPCGDFVACSDVEMTRICAVDQPECEPGYTRFNNRCYKVVAEPTSYVDARGSCATEGGHLTSVHNMEENTFVSTLLAAANVTASAWLGAGELAGEAYYEWDDGTPFPGDEGASFVSFEAWAPGSPSEAAGHCATIDVPSAEWTDVNCTAMLPFVCKKPSPVVNASCACTGEANAMGHGATCGAWGDLFPEGVSWCHVSEYCPRAVPHEGKFVQVCDRVSITTTAAPNATTTEGSTTPGPTCHGVDSTTYTRDDGQCAPCTASEDCSANQFLMGTCSEYTTPVCINCDSSCGSCTGLGASACETCAAGRVWSPSRETCVETCPLGFFASSDAGECLPCDASCLSCRGSSNMSCTACDTTSELAAFLPALGSMPPTGQCVSSCPETFYFAASSSTCTKCRECDPATQFTRTACGTTSDTECGAISPCEDDEYLVRPATPTSDARCSSITQCMRGFYQTAQATASSNTQCSICPAGTTDSRTSSSSSEPLLECVQCPAGTHTDEGNVGACPVCPQGTADDDGMASTACQPCVQGATFADEPMSTSCADVSVCAAGEEEALAPTVARDRVCITCTNGTYKSEEGQAKRCQLWTVCPAGRYPNPAVLPSATRDRACIPCPTGLFKPQSGNFPCEPLTECGDLEVESTAPTTSTDRMCSPCPRNFFFDSESSSCKAVSTCGTGKYVSAGATPTSDVECSDLLMCTEDEFESVAPGRSTDRRCEALTVCDFSNPVAPQYQAAAPVSSTDGSFYVSDRLCLNCTAACPVGRALVAGCSMTADLQCEGCTICGENMYEVEPCTTEGDRMCAMCNVCDTDTQFQVEPCTGVTNAVCQNLTVCDGVSTYEIVANTPYSDRECAPVNPCPGNTVEVAGPTPTSDRVCEYCDGVTTFFNETLLQCSPITDCAPGYEELTPPTLNADRVCVACDVNTFKSLAGQSTRCRGVTQCALGEVQDVAPTTSSDRVCKRCNPADNQFSSNPLASQCTNASTCEPGTFVDVPLTSASDRRCKVCADGTFTDAPNQASCSEVSLCQVGFGTQSPPSLSADRACAACAVGVAFSNEVSDAACVPATPCPIGEEEMTAPTASTDRVCRRCSSGFDFKDTVGQSPCAPVSLCGVGEEESAPPTYTSDRRCRTCPLNTYKSTVGVGPCAPFSGPCAAGTRQVGQPSAVADRSCEPCSVANSEYQDLEGATTCKTLTICESGTYVSLQPTSLRNRECSRCVAGTFSTMDNSADCMPCPPGRYQQSTGQVSCLAARTCAAGTYVSSPATPTSNAECTACNQTTSYQNLPNQSSCKLLSTCEGLYEQSVAPTVSTDRRCQCRSGVGYSADGVTGCQAVQVCSSQQVEFVAPTRFRNRVCAFGGRIGSFSVAFSNDFSVFENNDDKEAFNALLFGSMTAALRRSNVTGVFFRASLSSGSIIAFVTVTEKASIDTILDAVRAGDVSFFWEAKNAQFTATLHGDCDRGSVSGNGMYPGCSACPAGTYANVPQTRCLRCPARMISPSGSSSIDDCTTDPSPDSSTSGGGLQGGALYGLIIAVIVVLLALIVFVVYSTRCKRGVQRIEVVSGSAQRTSFQNPLYSTREGVEDIDTTYAEPGEKDGHDEVGYQDIMGDRSAVDNPLYQMTDEANLANPDYDNIAAHEGVFIGVDHDDDGDVHESGYMDVGDSLANNDADV